MLGGAGAEHQCFVVASSPGLALGLDVVDVRLFGGSSSSTILIDLLDFPEPLAFPLAAAAQIAAQLQPRPVDARVLEALQDVLRVGADLHPVGVGDVGAVGRPLGEAEPHARQEAPLVGGRVAALEPLLLQGPVGDDGEPEQGPEVRRVLARREELVGQPALALRRQVPELLLLLSLATVAGEWDGKEWELGSGVRG